MMVDVQESTKNNLRWPYTTNISKPGKTCNLFDYFTQIDDSHTKYLDYKMSKPLTIQTQNESPSKSESPQPFYHIHQDSITLKSNSTPVRFSPRMGSNAISYARSSGSSRASIHSNLSPINFFNIEQSIFKISAMFPTATEEHIKSLLDKYHNREAVVISALQVEKHPIATPGPYTPPSIGRHFMYQVNSSPVKSASSKPAHYSPKMKLRYLKSVFPVVEETVLLDTLCGTDNNVTQATERLLTMGFNKGFDLSSIIPKLPPRVTLINNDNENDDEVFWLRKKISHQFDNEKSTCPIISDETKPPNKKNSDVEELQIKQRLQNKYKSVTEKIIIFALESTDYNETLSDQILKNHLENESKQNYLSEQQTYENEQNKISYGEPIKNAAIEIENGVYNLENGEKSENSFTEIIIHDKKTILAKGPNRQLLSIKESSNSNCKNGIKAKGPNKSLLSRIQSLAKGPNSDLKKGPSKGLAKGSFFQKLFKKTVP
ncbi:uncharacterized protein LOC126906305 [Daktulosphaira vitifoliae]|uniref:uncharacterized protein LOC126906305 n=1 Tax=Daktulosphaira vitifoliae TaxID=58002 RepID=UPI0021A9BEEC|nr:uncharacterized protein LOC126906305 [Daktulosphaira vitifoliae]